ncbi:MAG: hypothetical protein QXM38_00430 [Candidatus Aenigmatarchaeota archaeon]
MKSDREVNIESELRKTQRQVNLLQKQDIKMSKYLKKSEKSLLALKNEIKEIDDCLSSLKGEIKDLKKYFDEQSRRNYDAIKKDVSEYLDRREELIEEKIEVIQSQMEDFNKKIINLAELINEHVADFDRKIDESFKEFNEQKLDKISFENTISSINSELTNIIEMFNGVRKEITSLFEVFNNKIDLVSDSLGKKIQKEVDVLDERFSAGLLNVEEKMSKVAVDVESKMKNIEVSLEKKLENISNELNEKLEKDIENLKQLVNVIKEALQSKDEDILNKFSFLEKNCYDVLNNLKLDVNQTFLNYKKEIDEKLDGFKNYLNEKIVSFQTNIDKFEGDYNELVNLNKMLTTLVNSFDKRLVDLSEKMDAKIMEIRESFEEKLKNVSDYVLRLVDDMDGYLNEKLKGIDMKMNSLESERTEFDKFKDNVRWIEAEMNKMVDEYKKVQKNLNMFEEKISDLKKRLDELNVKSLDLNQQLRTELEDSIKSMKVYLEEKSLEDAKKLESKFNEHLSLNLERLNSFEKEFNKNLERTEEISSYIRVLDKNLIEVKSKFENTMAKLNELSEKLNEDVSKLESKIESLNSLNEKRYNDIKNVVDEKISFEEFPIEEIKILISQNKNISEKIEDLKSKTSKLMEDYNFLKNELLKYSNIIPSIKEEMSNDFSNKFASLNKNIEDINRKINDLKEKVSYLEKIEEEVRNLSSIKHEFSDKIETLTKALLLKESEIYKKIRELSSQQPTTFTRFQLSRLNESINEVKSDFYGKINDLSEKIDACFDLVENLKSKLEDTLVSRKTLNKESNFMEKSYYYDLKIKNLEYLVEVLLKKVNQLEDDLPKNNVLDKLREIDSLKNMLNNYVEETKKELNVIKSQIGNKRDYYNENEIINILERLKNE